jgi:hypothetical protein
VSHHWRGCIAAAGGCGASTFSGASPAGARPLQAARRNPPLPQDLVGTEFTIRPPNAAAFESETTLCIERPALGGIDQP